MPATAAITILQDARPPRSRGLATKVHTRQGDGTFKTQGYGSGAAFRWREAEINSLRDLVAAIGGLEPNECIVRGIVQKPVNKKGRRRDTVPRTGDTFFPHINGVKQYRGATLRQWCMVDFDIVAGVTKTDKGVTLSWKKPVHADFCVPTMYMDATASPEVYQATFPEITRVTRVEVAAPHMRVRQVRDWNASRRKLVPGEEGTKASVAAENNVERLRELIEVEAMRLRGRGAIIQAGRLDGTVWPALFWGKTGRSSAPPPGWRDGGMAAAALCSRRSMTPGRRASHA